MIDGFRVVITTTGVAQKLATSYTPCAWMNIQPLKAIDGTDANVAPVTIGGANVTTGGPGQVINAGDTAVTWAGGTATAPHALDETWMVGTAGDGVQGTYGA